MFIRICYFPKENCRLSRKMLILDAEPVYEYQPHYMEKCNFQTNWPRSLPPPPLPRFNIVKEGLQNHTVQPTILKTDYCFDDRSGHFYRDWVYFMPKSCVLMWLGGAVCVLLPCTVQRCMVDNVAFICKHTSIFYLS